MKPKHIFIRFILFISVSLLASGYFLPAYYNVPYPAPLSPQFDSTVKTEHQNWIQENQPEIVLIGDSVLYEGVDPLLLTAELGNETYAITVPGSGTASWYLLMKNVIFESTYRPKYVVILFRNTMLSVPQYRTTGRYFALLDDFASKNEPLVAELAFINQMSPLEKFAQQYIPIYSLRLDIREDLDNFIRYRPTSTFVGCDRECTDDAVSSIFGREVDPIALNDMLEDAAQTLYAPEEMDFENQVEASFLPYMIQLAKENNIHLIFVKTKIFGAEPVELIEYSKSLKEYLLKSEDVFLLDFSQDPRITQDFYVDSLHMNPYGKTEFTKILANELNEIFLKE